jgi:hypothetical protein
LGLGQSTTDLSEALVKLYLEHMPEALNGIEITTFFTPVAASGRWSFFTFETRHFKTNFAFRSQRNFKDSEGGMVGKIHCSEGRWNYKAEYSCWMEGRRFIPREHASDSCSTCRLRRT